MPAEAAIGQISDMGVIAARRLARARRGRVLAVFDRSAYVSLDLPSERPGSALVCLVRGEVGPLDARTDLAWAPAGIEPEVAIEIDGRALHIGGRSVLRFADARLVEAPPWPAPRSRADLRAPLS
ncbi:MAG TPA: hypothetical protein PK264_22680, partial [Hyphomicrobiaceae bacterium]|nr:hypothetical protein [Hyphomicrobiaceae bacterium]